MTLTTEEKRTSPFLHKLQTKSRPCQETVEDLRDKFDRAVKQVEKGEVLSHEEVKNRYKNDNPTQKINHNPHVHW